VTHLFDASGERHDPDRPARRVVSLVPSVTETVFALGAGDALVGVTRFCEHPPEARTRCTVVGGTKSPRIAEIAALEPDLLLVNKEENRLEDVERLREIAPVYVLYPRDLDGAISDIETLGTLLGHVGESTRLVESITRERVTLSETRRGTAGFRFLYLIWKNPYMVAGRDTFIDALLSEAGGENGAPDRGRYPEVTREEIDAIDPDVVLLSSEPFPFSEDHARELRTPGCPLAVRLVDGRLLSWHGSSLRLALVYLRELSVSVSEHAAAARRSTGDHRR